MVGIRWVQRDKIRKILGKKRASGFVNHLYLYAISSRVVDGSGAIFGGNFQHTKISFFLDMENKA
jgi:hypothetical protein